MISYFLSSPLLKEINRKVTIVMANLNRLTTEVAELTTVAESAVALINGLSQQIKDAAGDQAKLDELTDKLDAQANSLAAAVAANTPAEEGEDPPADETP